MDRFDADEDGAKRALRVHDRPARRAGNLQAALAAWAVSLPYYLTVALLLTTGLRQPSAAPAITALFLGLFLFNAVPALTGWGHSHIGGPVTSTVLTYAALLAHHQALVDREPFALAALVVACGVASAIFQILFALTGTTRLLRFVPYPVVTSLSLGGMVLVFLSQLPILAGTSNWARIGKLEWDATSATLLVAAATFAILWLVPRIWPNVPASILALVVASFLGVLFTRAGYPLGFLEKTPPVTDALEPALGGIEHLPLLIADLDWPFLLISALTVALLNTFNSLMNASLLDEPLGEAPDDRRLLLAQGAGNLAAAAAGGITGCSTRFTTLAFLDAGGRSRRHAGLWAASMVPLLALAATALSFVPLVAVSVILLRMAFVSLDRWVVRLPIHLTTGPKRQRAVGWANVFALALMTMVIVVGGFAFGVLAGVAISLAWFVVRVGTLRLGEVLHGDAIRSKMVRSSAHLETLAKHGREIAIVQLKGPLYFGSAFRVLEATEKAMEGARWIVLDLRRVNDVDLSGARAIERIRTTLADSGRRLSIVIGPEGSAELFAASTLLGAEPRELAVSNDFDEALAEAENDLLERHAGGTAIRNVPLGEFPVLRGLAPQDLAALESIALVREWKGGETVFDQGAAGDSIFFLLNGRVAVVLAGRDGQRRRIAVIGPGAPFGEMALLDGQPRSASIVALEPIRCVELPLSAWREWEHRHPAGAHALLGGLALELASRLRGALRENEALQAI